MMTTKVRFLNFGVCVAAFAALLSAIFLFPRDVSAAGPTANEIGTRVQAFYDSTKTFKATFTQTYTIKVQNVKKVSTGKVTKKRTSRCTRRR
ncbi:MAG: hypothetical protein L6Q76_38635 [Polyangiaceae bacterium]|nr:hypothetical protein [Polyangiaceae bacterium]